MVDSGTEEISQEKDDAAMAVLKRYRTLARRREADPIFVVATEAMRQASNSAAFLGLRYPLAPILMIGVLAS